MRRSGATRPSRGSPSHLRRLGACASRPLTQTLSSVPACEKAFKPSIAITNSFAIMIEAPKRMPKASIQPSKLGCATLTLHGFDALRHRLHFGHTQASLSATLNLGDFNRFCAYALVDATRQWICKHARCTRFGQHSFLLPLISFTQTNF